jgi:formate C-acetyltransferase
MGLAGIRDFARERLATETDPEKRHFLRAVEISYDAACEYVKRYAQYAAELAASEADWVRKAELEAISDVCHELAIAKPTSFHAALQLVQFTRVFGGHGCVGRFDQWLYPLYKADIEEGRITQQQAQELLESMFIKFNEFAELNETFLEVYPSNNNLRNITLAGQTPDGEDACNELTYMCLRASAKLMLPEPKLNVRIFHGSPKRLLYDCCSLLAKGGNVLAIYNDEVALPALSRLGIPLEDVRDYCNDGCSELIIGGKCVLEFKVHDSLTVLTQTVLEAEGRRYETFGELLAEFKSRLDAFMPEALGGDLATTFPYFAASIEDCLQAASPMGARYSMRGAILAEVGNTTDGLAAIKKLVYEDRVMSWDDLVSAVKANYDGYAPLRQQLLHRAPHYGNDDDYVDSIVKEIAEYFCDGVHAGGCNEIGYGPKWAAGLMAFSLYRKNSLPASPDGRRQGDPVANSFSPALGMDESGPTAVFSSVAKVDLTKASHGSVLDIALHSGMLGEEQGFEKFVMLIESSLKLPCTATIQVNVIDREQLLRARENPDSPEFRTLIVRVWGFSARFVELPRVLQDHVLSRTEHRL